MAKYALVLFDTIQAIYEAEGIPDYSYDPRFLLLNGSNSNAQVGMIRGEDGVFVAPTPVVLPDSGFGRIVTVLAYRNRFTQAEKVAIKLASYGATPTAAALATNLEDLMSAKFVHLDRDDTVSSTNLLEAAGLLGVGRAAEILSDPVYSNELPSETRVAFGMKAVPSDAEMLINNGRGYTTLNEYRVANANI